MDYEEKSGFYIQGEDYCKIIEIMEKQLETRSGIGRENLEISYNELKKNNGNNISQRDLNRVTESLLFEIENK